MLKNIYPNENPLLRTEKNVSDEGPNKSHTLVTMDDIHARGHEGRLYSAHFLDIAVADDAFLNILIRVATGTSCHILFGANAGADALTYLYEGTTFTSDGDVLAARNRNRFKSRVATTLLFSDAVVDALGTELAVDFLPGGTGGNAQGGGGPSDFKEWLLAPGDHVFQIKNIGGGIKPASTEILFYEPSEE